MSTLEKPALSEVYNPTKPRDLTLEEQARVVGGYLMMAGAINPETSKAYGINYWGKVDILAPQAPELEDIGMQAMAVVALNNLFGVGMPHEAPEGMVNPFKLSDSDEQTDIHPLLAYNAQAVATEWGVDEAIRRLSSSDSPLKKAPDGTTLEQRVGTFLEKHAGAKGYDKEDLGTMLEEMHGLVGQESWQPWRIPYEEESKTLLHLQEHGSAQCVVFSTVATALLSRLGLDPRYAHTPEHQYLELRGLYYDGASYENSFRYPGTTISEKVSLNNTAAHNGYAISLTDTGRFEEAEAHYLEALKLNPNNTAAHNGYAISLTDTGRFEEAEAHYLEALKLNPNNIDIRKNYAVFLALTGNLGGAMAKLKPINIFYTVEGVTGYVKQEIPEINARIDKLNEGLPKEQQRPHVPMPEFAK